MHRTTIKLFSIFPDFFTLAMFPNIEKNNEAFNVAIALRKNMGAGCVFIGTLIFWCQSSPKFVAQKLYRSVEMLPYINNKLSDRVSMRSLN